MPSRSFYLAGKQFPICARCTGILLGYVSIPLFLIPGLRIKLLPAIVLLLPAIIDGYTQLLGLRCSNNLLRLITGLALGIGEVALIHNASIFTLQFLKYINR